MYSRFAYITHCFKVTAPIKLFINATARIYTKYSHFTAGEKSRLLQSDKNRHASITIFTICCAWDSVLAVFPVVGAYKAVEKMEEGTRR